MALYAGQYGPEGMEYPDGRSAKNVDFEIRHKLGGSLALLFGDKDRDTFLPNPVSSDGLGNLYFFAEPGDYDLLINGISLPITIGLHPEEPIGGGSGAGQALEFDQPVAAAEWVIFLPETHIPAAAVHVEYLEGFPVIVPWTNVIGGIRVMNGAECTGKVVVR